MGAANDYQSSLVDEQSRVNIGEQASIRLSNLLDLKNMQNCDKFEQLDSENFYQRESKEAHFVRLSNLEEEVEPETGLAS